jgi:hypothetical protein
MDAELFLLKVMFYFIVFIVCFPIVLFIGSFVGQFANRLRLIKIHGKEGYIKKDMQYYSDEKFKDLRSNIRGIAGSSTIVLFCLILVMVVITSIAFAFVKYGEAIETRNTEVNLYSIYSDTVVSGRFYLFGGTIGEKQVYEYFYMTSDGGFVRDYIKAEGIIIYQNDNELPRIEKVTTTKTKKMLFLTVSHVRHRYVIYVPEGSIRNSFKLN